MCSTKFIQPLVQHRNDNQWLNNLSLRFYINPNGMILWLFYWDANLLAWQTNSMEIMKIQIWWMKLQQDQSPWIDCISAQNVKALRTWSWRGTNLLKISNLHQGHSYRFVFHCHQLDSSIEGTLQFPTSWCQDIKEEIFSIHYQH